MGVAGPHATLDAHRADCKWLAQVYTASRPTKPSNDLLWARLGAKTLAMVHGAISDVEVTGSGLEEVVVDPEAIEAMRKLVEQGAIDLPVDRDLTTVTLRGCASLFASTCRLIPFSGN